MRYDWKRNSYGRFNRVSSWILMLMAALSWPWFGFLADRKHDWTLILAALIVTVPIAFRQVVMRKVYGVKDGTEEKRPEPLPEPRAPRDTSRPYPRPKGSRSKLNRVCPVCGTGRETGDLDGRLSGWPAHRTCAEWLGDWQPPKPAPPPYKPDPELIGYAGRGQKGAVSTGINSSPGAQVGVGNGNSQAGISEMLANGLITPDEARLRLNHEILGSFGIPGPAFSVSPGALETHTHNAGDPVPSARCACGAVFCGTPEYLKAAMKMHETVGCQGQSRLPGFTSILATHLPLTGMTNPAEVKTMPCFSFTSSPARSQRLRASAREDRQAAGSGGFLRRRFGLRVTVSCGHDAERPPHPAGEPLGCGASGFEALARCHPASCGGVERAQRVRGTASHGGVRVGRLPYLIVALDFEQVAVRSDQESAAAFAVLVLLGPAAVLEALPDRVGERGAHEPVKVTGLGFGRGEGVAEQLAHAVGGGESHHVRAVHENFRVRTDSKVPSRAACGITRKVDIAVVDESCDAGQAAPFPSVIMGRMSELEPVSGRIVPAPAADIRYENDDAVTRVFVRVEYADGRIREYQSREPQDFTINNPESAPSMVFSRAMSATREVRLSFRPSPRWNLHIRTEATAPEDFPGITY